MRFISTIIWSKKSLRKWWPLARDYIRKGDMFQCVLSQRFSADFSGKPLDYYRNLRVTNPSNYLYFYDFGEYQIIGASPESLVSVKDRVVTTNPIAGTRPRGSMKKADRKLAAELTGDPKEVAEHRMLVDLGRNDIGRIAQNGSVEVTKYMEVGILPLCDAPDECGQGSITSWTSLY